MSDPSSPLQRSIRRRFKMQSLLLLLLASALGASAAFVWTRDAGPDHYARGGVLFGLCLTALTLGLWLRRLAGRPAPPPRPEDLSPTHHFHRTRLGPAWTDWLAPVIPLVLVSPLAWVSKSPVGETIRAIVLLAGFLNVFVLIALVGARRAWVSLTLSPQGIELRTRSGRVRLVRRGELRLVRLGIGHTRTSQFGTVELDLGEDRPITLREPMNRPLPQIASAVAAHMGAPLHDLWQPRR